MLMLTGPKAPLKKSSTTQVVPTPGPKAPQPGPKVPTTGPKAPQKARAPERCASTSSKATAHSAIDVETATRGPAGKETAHPALKEVQHTARPIPHLGKGTQDQ